MRYANLLLALAVLAGACASTPPSAVSPSPTTTATPTTPTDQPPTQPPGTTTPSEGTVTTAPPTRPPPLLASAVVVDQEKAWAVAGDGRILRLFDMGSSWVDVSPPAGTAPAAVAFYGDHAWVALPDGTIYQTGDRGETWEADQVPVADGFVPSRMVFADIERGWFLANGDGAAGTIYAELFRTVDGGATWTLVAGPPRTDATAALESGHNRDLAATVDGRVWVTKDFGARVEPWVATSTDGGTTWTERIIPIDEACATLDPHIDGVSFGAVIVQCGNSSWFAITGDDGVTWQTAELPDVAVGMELFEDGAYAWGTSFMTTIEPPGNWRIVATFPAVPSSVSIPDAVNGLAVIDGKLWRTNTAGEQWEPVG